MIELIIASLLIIISVFYSKSFKRFSLRDIVILAILVAISSVGRYMFSMIPSVQPSSFIIITAGLLFGPAGGFAVGIGTALLSNILLGLGPYVLWQMFCWGLMGLIAGYLNKVHFTLVAVYGFIWGFLFGWITNLWWIAAGMIPFTTNTVLTGMALSFNMDLSHAVTNLVLLLVVPLSMLKKRLKKE